MNYGNTTDYEFMAGQKKSAIYCAKCDIRMELKKIFAAYQLIAKLKSKIKRLEKEK